MFALTGDGQEERESCALDVADRGGLSLGDVGRVLGITSERVRQIETVALAKVAKRARRFGLSDALGVFGSFSGPGSSWAVTGSAGPDFAENEP
jgi:hypothetical protein